MTDDEVQSYIVVKAMMPNKLDLCRVVNCIEYRTHNWVLCQACNDRWSKFCRKHPDSARNLYRDHAWLKTPRPNHPKERK